MCEMSLLRSSRELLVNVFYKHTAPMPLRELRISPAVSQAPALHRLRRSDLCRHSI